MALLHPPSVLKYCDRQTGRHLRTHVTVAAAQSLLRSCRHHRRAPRLRNYCCPKIMFVCEIPHSNMVVEKRNNSDINTKIAFNLVRWIKLTIVETFSFNGVSIPMINRDPKNLYQSALNFSWGVGRCYRYFVPDICLWNQIPYFSV